MRMWSILTIALIAFSTSAIGATDQQCIELWNGTCVGMSLEQVMRNFPQAKVLPPGLGETFADGAVDLVQGPVTSLWGIEFLPKFFFKGGVLSHVLLKSDDANLDAKMAQTAFEALTTDYKSKYGVGATAEGVDKAPMTIHAVNFAHDRSNISAFNMSNSRTSVLTILYSERLAQEADHPK